MSTAVGSMFFVTICHYPFAQHLECARNLFPGVPLNHERAAGLAECGAALLVLQECNDRVRKGVRIVCGDEFFSDGER